VWLGRYWIDCAGIAQQPGARREAGVELLPLYVGCCETLLLYDSECQPIARTHARTHARSIPSLLSQALPPRGARGFLSGAVSSLARTTAAGDDYEARAWTRCERLLASAFCPVGGRFFYGLQPAADIGPGQAVAAAAAAARPGSPCVRGGFAPLGDPRHASASLSDDLPVIGQLTELACSEGARIGAEVRMRSRLGVPD
jgi:hypothetical protein